MFPKNTADIEIPDKDSVSVGANTEAGWFSVQLNSDDQEDDAETKSGWSTESDVEILATRPIPCDDTKNKGWWGRIASKVGMWLTPTNIATFGITCTVSIVKLFRIREEANNPAWYGINKEHADEIRSCLSEYMSEASWGEALSTFFLNDRLRWEIIAWVFTFGLPTLLIVFASDKYKIYKEAWNMEYEEKKNAKNQQLEFFTQEQLIFKINKTVLRCMNRAANLTHKVTEPKTYLLQNVINDASETQSESDKDNTSETLSLQSTDIDDASEIQLSSQIKIDTVNPPDQEFHPIVKLQMEVPKTLEKLFDDQIKQMEQTQHQIDEETANEISVGKVWRNSYKTILLAIKPKTVLNFSIFTLTIYLWFVEKYYANKFKDVVPDIFSHQKDIHPFWDTACLEVMARALATKEIYNIKTMLISFLVPAIINSGVALFALPTLSKFKRIRRNDNEEETKLLEDAKTTYGTCEDESDHYKEDELMYCPNN